MLKRKRILKLFMLFFLVIQVFVPSKKAFGAANTEKNIPVDAIMYANEHYKEVVGLEKYYKKKNKDDIRFDELKLGSPFVIYETGEVVQDEIYYFPLLDSNDSIVLIMNVVGTTKGWSLSFSDGWVDELQELDVLNSDNNIYKSGDLLYVGKNNSVNSPSANSRNSQFKNTSVNSSSANISIPQLKNSLLFCTDKRFVKVDTEHIAITDENIKDKYTPSINVLSKDSKSCILYNKRGQGSNNMLCWAASVATICNYLKGSKVTARKIADKMKIGYDKGADIFDVQRTLKAYEVNYYYRFNDDPNNRMLWAELKNNISGKYPVYVAAKYERYGHAVVAYGFTVAAGKRYVTMWNPGARDGLGSVISTEFSESGVVFPYLNKPYVWTYSISRY